ncbi:MAG TPA: oligosaccharide flippase family protein [Solirubrobacteraceae bacterium]|nr:oligosaccharide flippase family protein [Solirubrobacteraceae bacterium]
MSAAEDELTLEPGAIAEETLTSAQAKSRAATGVAMLMGRGVAFQVLGFLGNLVLARLLVPEDFGLVAIGYAVVNLGRFLAVGGLGYAIVGRAEAPARGELRAITGLQLVITSTIGIVATAVAVSVGNTALVTAVMMLALPLSAFRSPAVLLLQRKMEFKAQVKIDATEVVVNLAWAIPAAALGFGAWSLATAMVVAAAAATVVACIVSPAGFLVPSLQLARLRSILGFGVRFQAVNASHLANDLVLTAGIGAIGGVPVLGLWNFAYRILRAPYLLFEAMWHVGFPLFARLEGSPDARDVGGLLERMVATVAVAVVAVLTPLVASSPALVPLLFGDDWADAALILPGSALAIGVYGPIGISGYAYLYAQGDSTTALQGSFLSNAVRWGTTFGLLPGLGVVAIGIGWAAAAFCELPLVAHRTRKRCGARLVRRVVRPALAGSVAGAAGWVVADRLGVTVPSALLSVATATAGFAALMWIFDRDELKAAVSMIRGAAREARQGIRQA